MTHEPNDVLEGETPCKCSFELWIKKYNLLHLRDILLENGLNSLDQCLSFARASDIAQKTKLLFNKYSNQNNMNVTHQDLLNCEYSFNSLLKLQQTDDFLVFLNKLSKTKQNSKTRKAPGKNCEWTLIFIDCDDTKSLLNEKKIRMINVENSINLLQASIYRMIDDDGITKQSIAGYHLGGDLFALFVNDNHGMTKSIAIVEYLMKIMSNKIKSSLTISCGIGIRRLVNNNNNNNIQTKKKEISRVFDLWSIMHEKLTFATKGEKEKKAEETDSLQREWVLRAHVNLLRAKENGKNCYFYQLEKIDTSKNNQDLEVMCKTMGQLLRNGYVKESESVYYDTLSKFDENTILNQAITTQTASSIYYQMAGLIFSSKYHIGNEKYRGYAATKQTQQSLKTFILGKMSIECYYCYKSWQREYIEAMGLKQPQSSIEDKEDNTEYDMTEYDITQLTRQRTADQVILPVKKNSALYWIKLAWEHLSDLSCSSAIVYGFLYEIGSIDKAFDYYEKLSLEMIKIHPKHGRMRCCLARNYYFKSMFTKAFDIFEQAVIDLPDSITVLSNISKYYLKSCNLGTRWISSKYTIKQRAEMSLNYCKQLMQLASQGKYIGSYIHWQFGELLYNWSDGFEKDKDEQRLALSMYEKAIEMEQCFIRDVINNWTRKYVKFESGLKDVIVWYGGHLESENVLNYADLIETYFANCKEKVNRARLVSNSVPLDWFVVSEYKMDENYCRKKARYCSYVSVRKPAKYVKKCMLESYGTYHECGIVLGGWYIESPIDDYDGIIAFNDDYNSINDVDETKFDNECMAKLVHFCTFMCDDESALKDVGLELDVTTDFKVLMIKLLIHCCWKLDYYTTWYRNIVDAINHSDIMTNMVHDFVKNVNDRYEKNIAIDDNVNIDKIWTLKRIGDICDKIEKIVDLNSQDCISKMVHVFEPKILCKKGNLNSILSINGNDMSRLFKDPFNLQEEIKICNLKLNALHNEYTKKKFTQWDLNRGSSLFDITFSCCIVEMFCQIATNF